MHPFSQATTPKRQVTPNTSSYSSFENDFPPLASLSSSKTTANTTGSFSRNQIGVLPFPPPRPPRPPPPPSSSSSTTTNADTTPTRQEKTTSSTSHFSFQNPAFTPASYSSSFSPSSSSSSINKRGGVGVYPTTSSSTHPNNTFADLRLISNQYVITNAFSKFYYNTSLGFLLIFIRITFSSSLHWVLTRIIAILSPVFFILSLINLAEALYVKYIKPLKWEKVKAIVSSMGPKQRALMGVDKDIANLVDAVSPRVELKKQPPIKLIKKQPHLSSALTQQKIPFWPLKPSEPTPYCYAKTSDVRNAALNFALRQPTREPLFYAEAFRSPLSLSPRPSFQSYQLSSVPTPEEQIIAGPFQLKYVGPLDTLREFQVYDEDLNLWVEHLREWLAKKIFHPLVSEMKRVEAYLESKGWSHLSIYNEVPSVDAIPTPALPSTSFGNLMASYLTSGKTPQSLNSLAASDPYEPLTKSRIQLERYLFMSTYPVSVRTYLVQRLLELARGTHLAAYRWDAGGSPSPHAVWVPGLPTDAELVMHVFCTWMDTQMPGACRGVTAYAPFTVKYFRPVDDKADLIDHMHIQMSVARPPHFRLCQKRTIYDVFPKRNNLFSTIALFTYKIQKDYSGYIDMLDISGNVVGLTSILSNNLTVQS